MQIYITKKYIFALCVFSFSYGRYKIFQLEKVLVKASSWWVLSPFWPPPTFCLPGCSLPTLFGLCHCFRHLRQQCQTVASQAIWSLLDWRHDRNVRFSDLEDAFENVPFSFKVQSCGADCFLGLGYCNALFFCFCRYCWGFSLSWLHCYSSLHYSFQSKSYVHQNPLHNTTYKSMLCKASVC